MRKVISIVMSFIILISTFNVSFAFEIADREVYSKGECERLLTYNGMKVITTYVVYNKGGVEYPAYCLDVTKPGAETGNYILHGGSKIQDVNVWRAVVNGYPYKSVSELGAANEGEAYTATKHAIYTILYNRNVNEYGPIDSDAGRRTYEVYKRIVNAARSSTESMVTDVITSLSTEDNLWEIDDKNPKYVSKIFTHKANHSNGKYEISCKNVKVSGLKITNLDNVDQTTFKIGEKFKILIPIDKMNESGSFEIVAKTELETKPVVYGTTTVPGKQDYALTGYKYEEQYTSLRQEYSKNITKLRIIKKEYNTEKYLPGVKFNLLNENKEVVFGNLVTNTNGQIVLDNMIPGKYYLEETETQEGYVLYTDLIEIGLDYNEEFEIVVNNKKREVTAIEKNFENIEVIASGSDTIIENNLSTSVLEKDNTTVDKTVNVNSTTNVDNNTEVVSTLNTKDEVNIISNTKITKLPKTGY